MRLDGPMGLRRLWWRAQPQVFAAGRGRAPRGRRPAVLDLWLPRRLRPRARNAPRDAHHRG
eukprot:3223794-Prymnesium_polylepis.1